MKSSAERLIRTVNNTSKEMIPNQLKNRTLQSVFFLTHFIDKISNRVREIVLSI